MMNCLEKAKSVPVCSAVVEHDGRFITFDSQKAFLIGFSEDIIKGEKFLLRGNNYGKYFLVLRGVATNFQAKIEPLSEDGARKAWGLMPVRAGIEAAFSPGTRTRRA